MLVGQKYRVECGVELHGETPLEAVEKAAETLHRGQVLYRVTNLDTNEVVFVDRRHHAAPQEQEPAMAR